MSNTATGSVHDRIARIVRAVSINGANAICFAGHDFEVGAAPQTEDPKGAMQAQLQTLLYEHCYCREFDGRLGDLPSQTTPAGTFVATLSAANATRERWSSGWTIVSLNADSTATLRRGSLSLRVWPGEYVTYDGPGAPPRIGARAAIHIPKESVTLQPGFYFAFGESVDDGRDTSNLVRFYWAIREDGAPQLLRSLSERFGRFRIPYRFKCSSMPAGYARLDPAVLYVDKRYYEICARVLVQVYDAVAHTLRPQTPLFAKRLAPGLGFAEDPGPAQSFGMQRCGIVAEGIIDAFAAGLRDENALVESVVSHFVRRGLSLERPYLNAGSPDTYHFDRLEAAA